MSGCPTRMRYVLEGCCGENSVFVPISCSRRWLQLSVPCNPANYFHLVFGSASPPVGVPISMCVCVRSMFDLSSNCPLKIKLEDEKRSKSRASQSARVELRSAEMFVAGIWVEQKTRNQRAINFCIDCFFITHRTVLYGLVQLQKT